MVRKLLVMIICALVVVPICFAQDRYPISKKTDGELDDLLKESYKYSTDMLDEEIKHIGPKDYELRFKFNKLNSNIERVKEYITVVNYMLYRVISGDFEGAGKNKFLSFIILSFWTN